MVDGRLLWVPLFCLTASTQSLPSWYRALEGLPGLESRFVQEGESAVFKAMTKKGTLQVAHGGLLRVSHDKGALLVCNGKTLVSYDPVTRSAQRLDLNTAMKDVPLLALLVDPSRVGEHYTPKVEGNKVVLKPKIKGLTPVELTGSGALLRTVSWVDRTGARQTLTLQNPELKRTFPAGTFEAKLPANTRWIQ